MKLAELMNYLNTIDRNLDVAVLDFDGGLTFVDLDEFAVRELTDKDKCTFRVLAISGGAATTRKFDDDDEGIIRVG